MTFLRFRRVRTGSFRDGREKMLVDFVDMKSNEEVGDWCPAWGDVEQIVLNAVEVEQTNDGDYVAMLRKVEALLAKRLPKLGIARHKALIKSYEPPMLNVEILDRDQPGWGRDQSFRLTCPVAQQLLDLVVTGGVQVGLIVREELVVDIRVRVGNDEASLPSLASDSVALLERGARMLVWA